MLVDNDKIQQLRRECHKDRPKTDVDLSLITPELNEERQKKIEEDRKRKENEKYNQSKMFSFSFGR